MRVKLMKITLDDGTEYSVWPTESYPDDYSDMRSDTTGRVFTGDTLMERVVTPARKLLDNLVDNYAYDYNENPTIEDSSPG